jgi:hypothetical protein
METFGVCVTDWMRRALAIKLMRWALWLLPYKPCHEYNALARALDESRAYDRYKGYTLMMGGELLEFEQWVKEWRWMKKLKPSTIKFPARLVAR